MIDAGVEGAAQRDLEVAEAVRPGRTRRGLLEAERNGDFVLAAGPKAMLVLKFIRDGALARSVLRALFELAARARNGTVLFPGEGPRERGARALAGSERAQCGPRTSESHPRARHDGTARGSIRLRAINPSRSTCNGIGR